MNQNTDVMHNCDAPINSPWRIIRGGDLYGIYTGTHTTERRRFKNDLFLACRIFNLLLYKVCALTNTDFCNRFRHTLHTVGSFFIRPQIIIQRLIQICAQAFNYLKITGRFRWASIETGSEID